MENKEVDKCIQVQDENGLHSWIDKQAKKLKRQNILFSIVIISWGLLIVYVGYLKFKEHEGIDFRSILDFVLIIIVALYVMSMHKMRKSILETYDTTRKLIEDWSNTIGFVEEKNNLINKQLELMEEKDDIIKEQSELINVLNAKVFTDGNEKRGDTDADNATSKG